MLTKAATHIRPLLRLQQHAHQPDLFTSNPSLLHHFQPAGVGNTLVAAQNAQTASGAGGSAGGAGRSGYSHTSSGGGYTGHARAFLSIQQGPGADASSLVASADDKKDAAARQRTHLVIKQRIANRREEGATTRVVSLRDEFSVRSGSRPVKLVEMEAAPEELPAPKRSSIAYPTWAALPSDSSSSASVWIPRAAPRRIGARAYHSRATRPLVSASPAPGTNRIDQPNHVFMDLAGLDVLPPTSPTRTQARRNSTASVVRPDVADTVEIPIGESAQGADDIICNTLQDWGSKRETNRSAIYRLIDHYRSARDQEPQDSDLAARYPLPLGYSTQSYNACLVAILAHRSAGESIAPILDIYNEMLARDVVPDKQTTALVIKALCIREVDVATATRRWEGTAKLAETKRNLGIDVAEKMDRTDQIEAYQSEGNLQSALKLYNVAVTFYPKAGFELASYILSGAAASAGLPYSVSADTIVPVIKAYLKGNNRRSSVTLGHIFSILAAAGPSQTKLIYDVWKQCQDSSSMYGAREDSRPPVTAAARAFIACGEVEKGISVSTESLVNAKPAAKAAVMGSAISALVTAGHLDRAYDLLQEQMANNTPLFPVKLFGLAQGLARAGDFDKTIDVVQAIDQLNRKSNDSFFDATPGAVIYANALEYVVANKSSVNAEAHANELSKLNEVFNKIQWGTTRRLDYGLTAVHADLLIAAQMTNEVLGLLALPPHISGRSVANHDVPVLRSVLVKTITAPDSTIDNDLRMLQRFAQLGQPITSEFDTISVPQAVVEKYTTARSANESASLSLSNDEWFRLVEAFNVLPTAYVESGAADAALEAIFADLAGTPVSGHRIAQRVTTSPAMADLVALATIRLGIERTTELVKSTFEPHVVPLMLPTPPASVAETSENAFTIPTPVSSESPPTTLQPPSAHTLHIAPKLDQFIARLIYPTNTTSPDHVYYTIRKALTQDNQVPSPEGLGRLITAIGRSGDEPKVRELYSLAQVILSSCLAEPTAQAEGWRVIEDSMISACCLLGHLEQAGMHRARIIEAGMAPSADAYATMIASSRDSTDEALVARELFDESQHLGVVPTLYLYNTIISKLSKARKAEMALELFTAMKAQGIRPSSVTYGAIINACCRVGDAESAATLFEEMKAQRNFKPRVPPFNTMMQLHLQTRPSRDRVLYYYDCMRQAGVRPSAHTYKLLLDAYGTLPPLDLPAMNRVFKELAADRSVDVHGTHWASLITAYGIHAGDLDHAMAVFKSIPSHPSTRNKNAPEPVVWEAIVNVVGQAGTLSQLQELHKELVASGIHSTAYVCNVLIAGYSRHGQIDLARAVFEEMGDSMTGFAAPNNHPALLTSSGHVKPSTTTAEPTNIVFREPSTYEAMIRAEILSGNREAAEAVLRRMEERRYPVAVWMKARAIIDDAIVNPMPPTPAAAAAAAAATAETP